MERRGATGWDLARFVGEGVSVGRRGSREGGSGGRWRCRWGGGAPPRGGWLAAAWEREGVARGGGLVARGVRVWPVGPFLAQLGRLGGGGFLLFFFDLFLFLFFFFLFFFFFYFFI